MLMYSARFGFVVQLCHQFTSQLWGVAAFHPENGDYTKPDEPPGSAKNGQFMDVETDGKSFKGHAKEPDKRRK
jgi:hypothetical protein